MARVDRINSVFAVRHAPADVEGICYGRANIPVALSPEQSAQAVMSQLPSHVPMTRVWSSPSQRTAELGKALAQNMNLPLELDERLLELDFGEWEGRRYDDIHSEDGERFARWAEDPMSIAPPHGESGWSLVERVRDWGCSIGDCTGLVVTHAGPIRAMRALDSSLACSSRIVLDFGRGVVPLRPEQVRPSAWK